MKAEKFEEILYYLMIRDISMVSFNRTECQKSSQIRFLGEEFIKYAEKNEKHSSKLISRAITTRGSFNRRMVYDTTDAED